ncbi:hypothetical protein LI90_2821 [Carbonactinospora thermoautotrophica]|uniref:Uncharacterized protein n=2 Tax=Carbonactinospora thermoautotrophica TaxID=1469144 RepID=A0A132MVA7_9ACTN|nr:rhodanese-like domain-containing protein [Carbonactinospora thermoautotrophica]KWX01789.1 hypothetical protein LI90_2821 [Carbonactinospora thermoautotrophica]
MPTAIDRHEVQRLLREENAQLVEVLPQKEYEWAHLAGAVHLPLKDLNATTAARLERGRPVIVYCNNTECDMSPRAAWRLERLGFPAVYDYVAGKMDWLSYGLPYEGNALLVGDLVRRDVPTCSVGDRLGDVRAKLAGQDLVVVLDDDRVVQGLVRGRALEGPDEALVEEVMRFGITTVRPSEDVATLTGRMRRAGVERILVTSSDGRLLGLLLRAEAEAALDRHRAQHVGAEP